MTTFFAVLVILLIFCFLLSIGVLFGRKPLQGSCGGMGAALGQKDYVCDLCGGDESKCEEQKSAKSAKSSLGYEVK